MRHYKKLTRTQRNLLLKAGCKEDLHNVYYLIETRELIHFTTPDGKKIYYNKETKKITEE